MPVRRRHMADWYDQSSTYSAYRERISPNPAVTFDVKNSRIPRIGDRPIGQQYTADEDHSRYFNRHGKNRAGSGDNGGDFYTERSGVVVFDGSRKHLYGEGIVSGSRYRQSYDGPFFATNPASLLGVTASMGNLDAQGATAIARCKPTNSVANAGVALGEIAKGEMPRLPGVPFWKPRTFDAMVNKRLPSDEYLNIEFGWLPVFSDIRSVAYAAANSHRILSGYEQNAGKPVRRKYAFPIESSDSSTVSVSTDGYAPLPFSDSLFVDSTRPQGKLLIRTRTYKRVWFSGSFTYHLPLGYNSRNGLIRAAARAKPLLGIGPDPELVWQLTPWTWALDWFSNIGDVVSNLSDWAVDGLAMRYGYIMEHSMKEVSYSVSLPSRYKPGYPTGSRVSVFHEVKRRKRATPFGFGLDWKGLSPRQIAIAIAIGFVFLREE